MSPTSTITTLSGGDFIKLGSIFLISPLAYFFGRELKKDEKQTEELEALKERSADAGSTISDDVKEVIAKEKPNLKEDTTEKLNEILEESQELQEETASNEK